MICPVCSNEFPYKKGKKFCSSKCTTKSWKLRARDTYLNSKKKYRETHKKQIAFYSRNRARGILKDMVLGRDYDKCRRCGSTDNLHVHHIQPIKDGGVNEEHNLITFCVSCHMTWHKFMDGFW